jgi:hypothetical protein
MNSDGRNFLPPKMPSTILSVVISIHLRVSELTAIRLLRNVRNYIEEVSQGAL